jgi:NAD(P)-dependent dehydrogenase (short-subunit alcohol dehydrogenase family)
MSKKCILITGAGSGFGRGAALGLAKAGNDVIATVQISPQVTALRSEAKALGLTNLRVEKLDILDPVDVAAALRWDFNVLSSNAAIGEGGPASEIPLALVRKNFETNVFAPLELVQRVVRKWIDGNQPGKIVFTSSEVGLFTPPGFGTYSATKHALESIAESLRMELQPFNIKVQTINPGAYRTGFNEAISETALKWLDDKKNFTKRAALQAIFDSELEDERDPDEVVRAMIEIVPSETGKFRNVVPQSGEESIRESEKAAWEVTI